MIDERTYARDAMHMLEHVSGTFHRQADQVLQERLGIGMSQYRIMALLHDAQKRQRDLADILGQTEAAISRQISLLAERGAVVSVAHPLRKRERIASLTPKGIKLALAAQDILGHYTAPMFDAFTAKQQQALLDALRVLHQHTCKPNKPFACKRLAP